MWKFEASNFEIRGDIFHFERLSEKNSKNWFPQDLSFFRLQEIANIPSDVFHTFCLINPALSDEKFLSIGFHMTCQYFRFQRIANISNFVFHT